MNPKKKMPGAHKHSIIRANQFTQVPCTRLDIQIDAAIFVHETVAKEIGARCSGDECIIYWFHLTVHEICHESIDFVIRKKYLTIFWIVLGSKIPRLLLCL